jgi:radical SAM superfamily enzyme YgiQ (UPF0313 family)
MKIMLVRPGPEKETIGLQHVMVVEPLELEILGALGREQDEMVLIDMILEGQSILHFLRMHEPDMVCITGYITNVGSIKDICAEIKDYNPHIITVVGGVHCEVCPEDFEHPSINFRVIRNAVSGFPKLLDFIDGSGDLPAGIALNGYESLTNGLPEIDFEFIHPDRSLTSHHRDQYFYIFHDKVALLKATFGCPFDCNFCFCRQITGGKYKQRPLDDVISELEGINETEIYIVDDDFLADPGYVSNFIDLLNENNIDKHFLVYGRADFIVKYPELMAKFRSSGLRTVIVGFESFFEDELRSYDKNISVQTNMDAMAILNRLKIECFATIILSPDWGKDDFQKLERILKDIKIHYVNLQPLTPLPGTGFEVDQDKLLIHNEDYSKWDLAHLTIRPTRLSVVDYYKQLLRLYNKIIFQPWVLKKYLLTKSWKMLIKMVIGSRHVYRQYLDKINEASTQNDTLTGSQNI